MRTEPSAVVITGVEEDAPATPAPEPAEPEPAPAEAEPEPAPAPRTEAELRTALGLPPADWALDRATRLRGWVATAAATVLAAVLRLVGLGHPGTLMFDEIYYVKDAYALTHNGYESTWTDGADAAFASGDFSHLTTQGSYIVHPQLGKWLIGLGGDLLGWDNPAAWRIAVALAGVLTVALLARLTLRLTGSPLLAGLAGFLLAIDGVAVTESRIALLDGFIGLFALLTVYCLVRDREWIRAHLAAGMAGKEPGTWAPVPLLRPWLLATGVAAGLACSVKWSGAYLLAAVGLTVVVWDATALRRVRARSWAADAVLHRGLLDFLHLVPVAFAVYVGSWWSWFTHDGGYDRGWAAAQRAGGSVPRGWLPDALNNLLEYHLSMYRFHVGLESTHPYMSKPIGWLVQWRPTSFYWQGTKEMAGSCPTGTDSGCVQAVTSIGNIPIWWSALVALAVVAWLLVARRDWRAWAALVGYVGLYLPWFLYGNRTIFTFYTVAFVPFVVLALALALGAASGLLAPLPGSPAAARWQQALDDGAAGPDLPAPRGPVARFLGFGVRPLRRGVPQSWAGVPVWRQRGEGLALIVVLCVAAAVFAVLWWPIWTGQTVSYGFWRLHMLLPTWI